MSTFAESMTKGMTLAVINAAMKRDAIGSNPVHPVHLIRMVEMMTPTLPSVSYDGVSVHHRDRSG
jgi:hypothetical protein